MKPARTSIANLVVGEVVGEGGVDVFDVLAEVDYEAGGEDNRFGALKPTKRK